MTKRYKNRFHRAMNDMNWGSGEYEEVEYIDDVPNRFRRNKIDGRIGGVCAGIGDYFGIDTVLIRVLAVIGLFMSGGGLFWLYLAFWIFVPKDQRAPYRREYREAVKAEIEAERMRENMTKRTTSFRDVKSKYRSLEARLAGLEKAITSSEWQLRRDFKDLEH